MNKAVFLDRDNTLIEDKEKYIYQIEKFKVLDGVVDGLKKLQKEGFKLIIVTNQGGIGLGEYSEDDYEKFNKHMLKFFEKNNIKIDKVYHCSHSEEENCDCRKPKIGMIKKAVEEFNIDLKKSWMIGDKIKDVEAGKTAKVKTIALVGPEYTREELEKSKPNFVVDNFNEVVDIILRRGK